MISLCGKKHPKKTTIGWELLNQTKEVFLKWIPMKDIKENNPVDLADYVVKITIDYNPDFAWWVTFTPIKRNRIVYNLKRKHCHTTHKFGIKVPTLVK